MLVESDLIRDAWTAGDRDRAIALLREAHTLTLQWLRVRGSTAPELKLAVDQEQYRRALER